MHRMALNIGKLSNRSRRFWGEIGLVIDSQGGDPMAVNQRVAGSSPADGANNYKAFKDEGWPRVALFGNIIGNTISRLAIIPSWPSSQVTRRRSFR